MTRPNSIVVAIDCKQPQSYLAFGPTCGLAAELGVAIDWRPYTVAPMEPPSETELDGERGRRHLRLRAEYLERDLERYAAAQGIALRGIYRAPDSDLAGLGLIWAKRRAAETGESSTVDRYIEGVFTGYWSEALDIEEVDAIRGCLDQAGVDARDFEPNELRGELDDCRAALLAKGVIGAPAYLVGDELFIGRAHLPMIRWLLEGKAGPAPI